MGQKRRHGSGILLLLSLMLASSPAAWARCPLGELVGGGSRRQLLRKERPPPPPACDLAALLGSGPYSPPEPPGQTATDEAVKGIAYAVLTQRTRSPAGSTNGLVFFGAQQSGDNTAKFLRAAFHDASTYDRTTGKGGANGSLRTEIGTDPLSSGLNCIMNRINGWRNQINALLAANATIPAGASISYGDVFQLLGAVAVEFQGGPRIYDLVPVGRVDSPGPVGDASATLGRKTDDAMTLQCHFARSGWTPAELVALSGAHTLGFQGPAVAGTRTPMTPSPYTFNNEYFSQVLAGGGAFPSDNALAADNATLATVQRYAADQDAWFADFAAAYVKMGKLGAAWRSYGP